MIKKTLFWQRSNYTETGFDLVEVFEDGTMVKKNFEHRSGPKRFYEEIKLDKYQLNAAIVIESLKLAEDGKLAISELDDNLQEIERYELRDWKAAREQVLKLQSQSKNDLSVDYHSVLVIDEPEKAPADTPKLMGEYRYPIVPLRVVKQNGNLVRKENPEQLSIEFVPTINEQLYFHNIPENNHVNMTGDNLFALDVKTTDRPYDYSAFLDYIQKMLDKVEANIQHYHDLIISQRERRAMLETDEMGDLYPR